MGISDIFAAIRANIRCLLISIMQPKALHYNPYIRIGNNSRIKIRGGGVILQKGVLISSNSVISASDGGQISIGKMVGINRNSMIMCHDKIDIGDNTIMGPGVYIYDHDHRFDSNNGVRRTDYETSPISIGRNCWIGAGTIILRGSSIGNNCLIAAGSIIKGSYPDGSIVIQKRNEIIKN